MKSAGGDRRVGHTRGLGDNVNIPSGQLAQTREISVWRLDGRQQTEISRPGSSVRKTTGDPRIGSPVETKGLATEMQLLQQLVIFWQVMLFEIIEEFSTAGSHLQKPAARVEIFTMRAQVPGQVIDASGQERDLDFGRAGILIVSFIGGDDLWFNDCGGHGFMLDCTTVGSG